MCAITINSYMQNRAAVCIAVVRRDREAQGQPIRARGAGAAQGTATARVLHERRLPWIMEEAQFESTHAWQLERLSEGACVLGRGGLLVLNAHRGRRFTQTIVSRTVTRALRRKMRHNLQLLSHSAMRGRSIRGRR